MTPRFGGGQTKVHAESIRAPAVSALALLLVGHASMPGMRRGAWYAQAHMLDHGSDMRWDGDDDDIDDDLDIKARPFSAGSTVDLGDGNSTPS